MNRMVLMSLSVLMVVPFFNNPRAQDIYDLRKLTQEDWLSMTTDQRMNALSIANKEVENQTFMGNFGHYYDLYKRWGYEFYEMEDRYENYAFRGFENYNIIEERRRRWSYNMFGDRIPRMRASYTLWNETYNDDGTFTATIPTGWINAVSPNQVDGVWVAKESTNDWSVSAVAAGALRAKYTPLTLSIPNIHGMRVDFQSANNSLSIVNSVLLGDTGSLYSRGGAMLRGGYFRRKLGALTLGATYVNQYSAMGNREGGDDWYGSLSNYTPTPMILAIRVSDDSPEDGEGGPVVSNVRLKINGRYRDDIRPQVILDDLTRDRTSFLVRETDIAYLSPDSGIQISKPDYDFLKLDAVLPKYADYMFYMDAVKGVNLANLNKKYNVNLAKQYFSMVDPGIPLQLNGTQYAVYWFDISSIQEKVNRAEAELTVSNDYRVETTMIYTTSSVGGHDTEGTIITWYKAAYWNPIAQADGNVKDGSNVKRIQVDFGFPIAAMIYGFNADFNYRGFKVTGEYVTNSQHYQFPDAAPGTGFPEQSISNQAPRTGHKWAVLDNAYYLTVMKDWRKYAFGGELFKMGKFFRPYFDYFYSSPGMNSRNMTIRFPFVEDNDDNDQYPDTMIRERSMGYNILGAEDPDGVFPGNDSDFDGIADNNKNLNNIPDYDEPFLMFDVDPDQFVFGNDYNNNGIPDFREDDMKMDLPYDLDRQGHHLYVRYTPIESVNLFLGSFHTKGVGRDNRTNDDYFKLQVNYDVFDIGKFYAEYRHEKIQDNIRDPYIQVVTHMKENYMELGITSSVGRFKRELFYDELEYQNSSVDRLFIDSRIRALPSITLENHLKLERNTQLEGLMYNNVYQPKLDINTMAMVSKIVYTKSWGNWVFSPGVKFRFYKKDRSESVRAKDFYMLRIPLIMLKYVISPRTDLMLGFQGFPGMEFTFKDYIESANDYHQKTYTMQLQNRSTYFGYQIWAATGIRFDQMEFTQSLRSFENYKTSTLFVKIFCGGY